MRNYKGQFMKGFPHNKGIKRDKSFKEKCRKRQLGKILSERIKLKISESLRGKTRSQEHCENISKSKLGKKNGMFGKKWSDKTRLLLSISNKGENSPNWKGGVTSINRRIRYSVEYKIWRKKVFTRDNFTCRKYHIKVCNLHPHHIKNFSSYPELRFDIDNGITLSEKAHREFHKKYGSKDNNIQQIIEFLQ